MGFGRLRFRRSFGQVKAQFRGARPKFYPLFTGLLDTYAGASAAYSLRRLSQIASSVVRVRRASDNAEKDFTADDITDGTLVAWVGAGNDGFVETWYDQSGNGNDAVQQVSGSQPKIVDAGVLVSGGLEFDGSDDFFETSLVPPDAATLIGVANWDVEDQSTMIIGARDSADKRSYIAQTSSGKGAIGVFNLALADVDIVAGDDYLLFGAYSGSTLLLSTNGSVASGSYGSDPNNTIQGYSVGALNTAGTNDAFMDGTLAEVIVYNSDQSSNRVAIETNINNQYDIY